MNSKIIDIPEKYWLKPIFFDIENFTEDDIKIINSCPNDLIIDFLCLPEFINKLNELELKRLKRKKK